ncbi:MAG: 16S rRNA (cytosine(967)-C(5))-methyltransferase RsmB [Clostridiales bacterium]|nr:16S rRNA (cytosine(967)-C(5))-methyltransferase RsmB [Clostridiales bacterium]
MTGEKRKAGKPKAGAREGAFDVLMEIENGAYANLSLDAYLESSGRDLSREDRALLTELVLGTVKDRLTLDWMIDQQVKKPAKLEIGPRILLRLGLYQLFRLERIPARAATFETVALAGKIYHRGIASLINGVMRGWLRDQDRLVWPDKEREPALYLSVRYSHPLWLAQRWLNRYGFADTASFFAFNNAAPVLWVRANTLRISPAALAERLVQEGCEVAPGDHAPEALALIKSPGIRNLASFHEGLFTVQDESSMLAAHALGPLPGQRVLDACAAPGGKTTHMAQLMQDRGYVAAWDVHPHRVALIREAQQRMGIKCIEAYVQDAAGAHAQGAAGVLAQGAADAEGGAAKQWEPLFDRILVDAPCSGLGVLRRRADERWSRKPEDIPALARLQAEILHHAMSLLAPGGRLLYSTCTTEPEENRLLVEQVLKGRPGYRMGKLAMPQGFGAWQPGTLGQPGIHEQPGTHEQPGIHEQPISGQRYCVEGAQEPRPQLPPQPPRPLRPIWDEGDSDVQLLPFVHGLEGFYMAVIERI